MIRVLTVLAFSLLFISCQREGCLDINSADYDPEARVNDGICSYRYLRTVSVTRLPSIYDLAFYDYYEPEGNFPDLQFRLVKEYDDPVKDYYDLLTGTEYEVVSPLQWEVNITGEYLLSEMEYRYELVDVDYDGEDIIMTGSFIPAEVYHDNEIVLRNEENSIELVLSYIIY